MRFKVASNRARQIVRMAALATLVLAKHITNLVEYEIYGKERDQEAVEKHEATERCSHLAGELADEYGVPSYDKRGFGVTTGMVESLKYMKTHKLTHPDMFLPVVRAIYEDVTGEETTVGRYVVLDQDMFLTLREICIEDPTKSAAAFYEPNVNVVFSTDSDYDVEKQVELAFHEKGHEVDNHTHPRQSSELTSELLSIILSIRANAHIMDIWTRDGGVTAKYTCWSDEGGGIIQLQPPIDFIDIEIIAEGWRTFRRLKNGDYEEHAVGFMNALLQIAKAKDLKSALDDLRNATVEERITETMKAVEDMSIAEFRYLMEEVVAKIEKELQQVIGTRYVSALVGYRECEGELTEQARAEISGEKELGVVEQSAAFFNQLNAWLWENEEHEKTRVAELSRNKNREKQ